MKLNKKIINKIIIELKRKSESELSGVYRSLFKGSGIEFDNIREYTFFDEYKNIEWNTSSRMGKLFVKEFKEERNIPVHLIVDVSSSMNVELKGIPKINYAANLSVILGSIALKNKDPISLTLFSSEIEYFSPPSRSEKALFLNYSSILKNKDKERKKTDFVPLIDFLMNIIKRRSLVFVISDFLPFYFENKFLGISKKNNLFFLMLRDPIEENPPATAIFNFYDPETYNFKSVDFSDKEAFYTYKNTYNTMLKRFKKSVLSRNIDLIDFYTDEDPLEKISNYFKIKARKKRGNLGRKPI